MSEFRNKIALVTGASEGIGLACVESLASKGCKIAMLARHNKKLKEKCEFISSRYKVSCLPIQGDVAAQNTAALSIKQVLSKFSRLDIIINNSGGPPLGSFLEHDDIQWYEALNLNLLSVVRFTKLAFPIMKKNGFGRIVNILSLLAKEPTSQMVLSSTARAGVMAFTKSASYNLAPHGITINNICPGGVLTKRFKSLLNARAKALRKNPTDFFKERASTVPLGRFAIPEEIANVASFLCSKESSFITGTSIFADGGQRKSI